MTAPLGMARKPTQPTLPTRGLAAYLPSLPPRRPHCQPLPGIRIITIRSIIGSQLHSVPPPHVYSGSPSWLSQPSYLGRPGKIAAQQSAQPRQSQAGEAPVPPPQPGCLPGEGTCWGTGRRAYRLCVPSWGEGRGPRTLMAGACPSASRPGLPLQGLPPPHPGLSLFLSAGARSTPLHPHSSVPGASSLVQEMEFSPWDRCLSSSSRNQHPSHSQY